MKIDKSTFNFTEELERQLRQLREDQLRKMYELQNEINLLKNRPPVEATPRQVLPPPPVSLSYC